MIAAPATIRQLAEWMADGHWLDMRTPMGRAQRVRVIRLTLHLDRDEIELLQEWFTDREKIKRRTFTFDAEDCWDCKPTVIGLLDVSPLEGRSHHQIEPPQQGIPEAFQPVIDAILDATCFVYGCERDELGGTAYSDGPTTHYRHMTILVIFEMTNLSAAQICKEVFGYVTAMPWQSATWKIRASVDLDKVKGCRVAMRKIGKAADARLKNQGLARCRRTFCFPPNYSPVLPR